MSVYHQTLVVYGWRLPVEQYERFDPEPDDDRIENLLARDYGWRNKSEGDVACIYDARAGRYCYFGVVVAATNSTRDGAQDFGDQYALGESPDTENVMELGRAIGSLDLDVSGEPQHHVFTHVT